MISQLGVPDAAPSVAGAVPTSVAAADGVDRRVAQRLTPEEATWLQSARIKYGATVAVLDVSETGIRIETSEETTRGARLVLELVTNARAVVIPARVVRCETDIVESGVIYRAACAFDRKLPMPTVQDLQARCVDTSLKARLAPETGGQKVIARFLDGRLLRGYTGDFHTNRPHLHLTSEQNSRESLLVFHSQLKALFFVRDFDGNPGYVEHKEFTARPQGRRVEVTFLDGEILVGATLNFQSDKSGFFVQPADPASNNLRVFVPMSAIRHMRFI